MRRRIAVAPNDNFDAKLSRFKGLAIVRVQTSIGSAGQDRDLSGD